MEENMVSISVSIAAVIAASIAAIYAGKQVSEAKKVTKLQIMSHVY